MPLKAFADVLANFEAENSGPPVKKIKVETDSPGQTSQSFVEGIKVEADPPGQTSQSLAKGSKVEADSPGQTSQSLAKGSKVEADSPGQSTQGDVIFEVNRICEKTLKYDLSSITLKCTCCGKRFACSIVPLYPAD